MSSEPSPCAITFSAADLESVHQKMVEYFQEKGLTVPSKEQPVATEEQPVSSGPAEDPLKLPPGHILVVREKLVTGGSQNEHEWSSLFGSYESASKYIISQFDKKNKDARALEYLSDDYDEMSEQGFDWRPFAPLPSKPPGLRFANKYFNPKSLHKFVTTWNETKLWGPYNVYHRATPYEINVELFELK